MEEQSAGITTSTGEAFVAIPNDVRIRQIYNKVLLPALKKLGFSSRSTERFHNGQEVDPCIEDAQSEIARANIFICDLTLRTVEGNQVFSVAEVNDTFYLLGIAFNLKKPIIIISQTAAELRFNLRETCIIQYEDTNIGLVDLQDRFQKWVSMLSSGAARDGKEDLAIYRRNLYSNSLSTKHFAIKYLGEYRDESSYPIIEKIVSSHYYYSLPSQDMTAEILRDAYTALFKINAYSAMPYLVSGLRNGFGAAGYLIRERIVNLLGSDVYSPPLNELVNQMIAQLDDSSWGVRQAVCRVLGKWGKLKALDRLSEQLQNDSELQVRLAAAEAFEILNRIKETSPTVLDDTDDQELSPAQQSAIAERLARDFNTEEMKDLCFQLNIYYDGLDGQGKNGKIRELILYFQRRGEIRNLIDKIDEMRPRRLSLWQKLNEMERQ